MCYNPSGDVVQDNHNAFKATQGTTPHMQLICKSQYSLEFHSKVTSTSWSSCSRNKPLPSLHPKAKNYFWSRQVVYWNSQSHFTAADLCTGKRSCYQHPAWFADKYDALVTQLSFHRKSLEVTANPRSNTGVTASTWALCVSPLCDIQQHDAEQRMQNLPETLGKQTASPR